MIIGVTIQLVPVDPQKGGYYHQRYMFYKLDPTKLVKHDLFNVIADGEEGLFISMCDDIKRSWDASELAGYICHGGDRYNEQPYYGLINRDQIIEMHFEKLNDDTLNSNKFNTVVSRNNDPGP